MIDQELNKMLEQGIVRFGEPRLLDQPTTLTRPINIVFLTSVRDTGTEDRNGTWVETGRGLRYMEGAIERIVKEIYPGGRLAGLVQVRGVITDDMPRDMEDSSYSFLPEYGRDWIHPPGLSLPDGRLVADITYNIPSSFRDVRRREEAERKQLLKYEFEEGVFQRMRVLGGDILISDHYMARLDYLWGEFGLYGRLLNIHPAVTVKGYKYRFLGKTPTVDAITSAKVDPLTRTGATLHFINKKIDDGPPIGSIATTPVFADDEPQWLRYRNYQGAKLLLFVASLAHYAGNICPYLNGMTLNPYNRELDDLSKLQPICEPRIIQDDDRRAHNYENILLR